MNQRLGETARRVRAKLSPKRRGPESGVGVSKRITRLRKRVDELELEVQEARRLNRRVAELLDLVEELLLPVAQRDEKLVQEYLERYSSSV